MEFRLLGPVSLAAVAALCLTLSACDDGGGAADGDRATAASGSPAGPSPSQSPAGTPAEGDCTLGRMTVTLEETGGTLPAVVLKATNRSGEVCTVHGAPFVGDTTAGTDLRTTGSPPRSVIRIAPGRSAYAAIALATGQGAQDHRTKTVNITLATEDGKGTRGHAAVRSPGPVGLALNAESSVTYWHTTAAAAQR
ncbi:DUF4232 domain-containing protein [Streptomyces silaceus]|uniref:DUF4232 domain-containing protein n=1 Tax=Streptomyces silaceus TaxID=545123 RepID=UPI0006EBB09B|nr:DUF4232 domain-containing protein [Streptomyces silaceus]